MQNMYHNQQYLQNNPTWHSEDAAYKAQQVLRLLHSSKISYSFIIEVGCGSGEILKQLAQQLSSSISFTGYDISQDAITIANTKNNTTVQFYCKDFTEENTTSDLLLIMDVVEHVENYFQFLKDIQPKSNYTIFHIPLDMCVWALFREDILIESKNRVGHLHNFTEKFILKILEEIGFTVVQKIYTKPLYKRVTLKEHIIHTIRVISFWLSPKLATKLLGGYSILLLTKNSKQ